MVGRVWGNVPLLGLLSDVSRQPYESVVNCPLPCEPYGSFKLFTIAASDFDTVGMCRRFCACAYDFNTTLTKGVVHGVYKVVIRPSYGVIRQHKVS